MHENEISGKILAAAIEVHNVLGGPGLLESCYEKALTYELILKGLKVERQKTVPIYYKDVEIGEAYRLDMLVEDKVIVECKATTEDNQIYCSQVLTYLRLTGLKLGIVVNFGMNKIKDGYHRVLNGQL